MKNYTFLFLFGALIAQSELTYSCEVSEKQSDTLDKQGLAVVQQLSHFQRYANQRQKEMREEAEMLRPSFDECRSFISAKIRCLENERRDIVSSSFRKYQRIWAYNVQEYIDFKAAKIQEYFQKFLKSGEIGDTTFQEMVESFFFIGKVLEKDGKVLEKDWKRYCATCTSERNQALIAPIAKMVRLNFLMLGLEDYALFNVYSPVSQLRTQFVTINSLLETAVTSVPREVLLEAELALLEAELQEVKATREELKVEAKSYQITINDTSDALKQLFLAGDFTQAQVVTQTMQKTAEKLTAALSQQQDLARKEGELVTHLAALPINENRVGENSCFESLIGEVKHCARLLQLYASESEVQKLPYKFNALSLQDQEFVKNVLALSNRISFQVS